jgi:hypothetical protein
LGDRRHEGRSYQTWPEAHYPDPQDAEAGNFPAFSPKPEWDVPRAAESDLLTRLE